VAGVSEDEQTPSTKGHSRNPSEHMAELTYTERIDMLLNTGSLAEQFNYLINRPEYLSTMKNEVRHHRCAFKPT
jgi:hypothetical protein